MEVTSKGTQSRRLVDSIAARISDFALKPGQRLIEQELARAYEVSRTPVREALNTLQEMGLVKRLPSGGFAVRVVKLESVSDLMVIWATLEDLAIQLASTKTDRSTFERLLEKTNAETTGDPVVDEELHAELARLSQNTELIRLLDTIYTRTQPYRRLDGLNRGEQVHDDHVRLLQLLIDGDVDGSRVLIREHIEKSHHFIKMLIRGGVQSLSFDVPTE